jgi:predicted nucleic acid-binding protein/predicted transcriptional regulator
VVWWRGHGESDLLTWTPDATRLQLALDANVFLDLEPGVERSGGEVSRALLDDWLGGELELVVTPEVSRELVRGTDDASRARQLARLAGMPLATPVESVVERNLETLEGLVALPGGHGQRRSCVADLRQAAAASAAGIAHFVTRDYWMLTTVAPVAQDALGLTILGPEAVLLRLDELSGRAAFQPVALENTNLTARSVVSSDTALLGRFLSVESGERRSNYRSMVRGVFGEERGAVRTQLIIDPVHGPIVFFATKLVGRRMEVPILRVRHPSLRETIAKLVLFQLRRDAVRAGASELWLTDHHAGPWLERIAAVDGFTRAGAGLGVAVIRGHLTVDGVVRRLEGTPELQASVRATARSDLPEVRAAVEGLAWPVVVSDLGLSNFMIPIRPRWSMDLIGYPRGLWGPADFLGLSRERVYYRAPTLRGLRAPGRVLWYVSGLRQVVARSRVLEVTVGDASAIFRENRRYGVFGKQEVLAAAKRGQVMAIRFGDTEVFSRPVELRDLRRISRSTGAVVGTIQAPQSVSEEMFEQVHAQGTLDV